MLQEKQELNGLFNKSHLIWNLLPVNPRHLKGQPGKCGKKSFVILQDAGEEGRVSAQSEPESEESEDEI